ncbi:NERD domain-containing protein [Alloiococcus sp. CFN-8]|uniref:NERD domain-containing protein n=1 Tax=Alloiococcus sp. CFN-8 TaxID=3416081 RepID=UPI003CF42C75
MGLWSILKGEQPGIIEGLLHYKNKGQYGEYLTEYALGHDNIKGYLKIITNVYIPYKGRTTEIDVVMVHEKGIFVFESKNYSGWIFGSEQQQKWTQSFPNGDKTQFYNPIIQNQGHIKALTEYLGTSSTNLSSYIIFSERCELKRIPDNNHNYRILKRNKLLKELRKELESKPVVYTRREVDNIGEKLATAANVDKKMKEQHINEIKERISGTTCPFCGEQLVERKGQYGAFYGCSTFPKCKYKRKI